MKIDGNEFSKLELKLSREGKPDESLKIKREFLDKLKESGVDHCTCPCSSW
jgi:hypothetical protein